jgi:hypothetical protein
MNDKDIDAEKAARAERERVARERADVAQRVQDQVNDLVAEGIRHNQIAAEKLHQAGVDVPADVGPMLYDLAARNISASLQVLQAMQKSAEALLRLTPTRRDERAYGRRPLIEVEAKEGKDHVILRMLVENRDTRKVEVVVVTEGAEAGQKELQPGDETFVRMRVAVPKELAGRFEIKARLTANVNGVAVDVGEIVQPFEVVAGG